MFIWGKKVDYLGHIASHKGVKVYPNQIKSMMDWNNSQKLEEYKRIFSFNRVLPRFCLEILKNGNTFNNIIEEWSIFLDSRGNSSLWTT